MSLEAVPEWISVCTYESVDVWCYSFRLWTVDFDVGVYVEEGQDQGEDFLRGWEEAIGHSRGSREELRGYGYKYFYSLGYRTYPRGGRPTPVIPDAYLDGSDEWKVLVGIVERVVRAANP